MKKIVAIAALLPALSLAHESHSHEIVHAAEHNLANPLFAVALVAGLGYATYRLVKTYAKKRS